MASAKAYMGEFAEASRMVLARQRPLSEVVDRRSFTIPASLADATSRMKENLGHFKVNYAVISAGIVFFSLLWHPWSFFILLVLAAAWFFLYLSRSEPVVLFNRSYSGREVLAVLGVITIAVIFFTSTGSTIMTSLAMSAALVGAHAVFRTPEDLFLENPESFTQNQYSFQPHSII